LGPEQEHAFKTLKQCLTRGPILALPDYSRQFVLETDASIRGIGGVLSQDFPDGKVAIAFASRTLSAAESRYATRELEALACIAASDSHTSYLAEGSWC